VAGPGAAPATRRFACSQLGELRGGCAGEHFDRGERDHHGEGKGTARRSRPLRVRCSEGSGVDFCAGKRVAPAICGTAQLTCGPTSEIAIVDQCLRAFGNGAGIVSGEDER